MITFVIPNFFSMIESLGVQSGFPALEKMLSKAKVEKTSHDNPSYENPYDLIRHAFNAPKDNSPGIAPLLQLGETGIKSGGWSCIANPVIVSPNRDQLDLEKHTGFDITHDEAISFCDEFNDYFKEDGISFLYTDSGTWFCHAETEFETPDISPQFIEGQNIAPHIPQGKSGSMWRKIFNEMQLLLHHSKTNQKRSQSGKPEINSIWFWGGGTLNQGLVANSDNAKTTIFSDDNFSKGLALSCEYTLEHIPEGLPLSFDMLKLNERNIFVSNLELINWLKWDKYCFSPALHALKQGQIDSIVFYLDLNKKFILQKRDLLRFWVSKKAVSDFIDKK